MIESQPGRSRKIAVVIVNQPGESVLPELPEVETVVRDLRGPLIGRRVGNVRVSRKKLRIPWSPAWGGILAGRTIAAVERRGKWILIDLGGPWLLVHLGMSGQLRVVAADSPRALHTHVMIPLDDAARELRFRDPRRFGCMILFADRAQRDAFLEDGRLGPEPFALEAAVWRHRLAGTWRCLKAVLLDQAVVAGMGNIYADEALYEARLHPALPARNVTPRQADTLRRAIARVLTRAIECRGSTIRDYVGGSGCKGSYQDEHRAYGRTGEPCARCDTPIERIVLSGRSTHFCPACQRR
jgi:formamidopyrimidine-DNA glycosylase